MFLSPSKEALTIKMSKAVYPQESVYNLVPKEEVHLQKTQRYVSKFRPAVVLEKKSTKDAMRTMGPAKVEVPTPEKYLKKHSKEPKLPEPLPMKPKPTSVDTSKGHKQLLENSGLVPKYIKKKHYGEVPEYLQQRNEEEQRAQEEYDMFVEEQREQGAMKHLSDEERHIVLEGLKKNWDELHHEYQGLSLVTDNLSKKARRDSLGTAMRQLENDIKLIERFKTIYIPSY
ncbi:hypothetical protein F7725_028820 [Dissostichus mawsoni]|uniref:Enkurin domain-containing protein n=1 Tax=Dissostichus mawsoni TaxID=36200 RepID=A0A7J5XGQ7_DISMA|nr:hypothetical protein F7725_028820 [Dissostichus mawsoni]